MLESMGIRMTAEDYDRIQKRLGARGMTATATIQAPAAKKYHNVPTAGYHSKKEALRAQALRLLQQAGEIQDLQEQVVFQLLPVQRDADGKMVEREVRYVADFVYHRGEEVCVEDSKGMRTPDYVIKRKLMLHVHKIRILET